MGEDKALLPFGDFSTLTQYQLHKLKKIFTHVYISCKDFKKFSFDASFIEDIQTKNIFAPTAGFLATFKQLDSQRFFVISVDTPFISENIIHTLLQNDTSNSDATIARIDSKVQPMCGIYHRSLDVKFNKMLEDDNHKLGFLLKNSNTTYVDFTNTQAFLNLNTPQDYKKALTLV